MRRQVVGVEKTVLRWARETAGLTPKAVAVMLKRGVAEVRAWEAGTAAPTYRQLEKLAYEVYKRPLAAFFLPSPPNPRRPRAVRVRRGLRPAGGSSKPPKEAATSSREYRPDRVSTPGSSLRDLLVDRGISPSRLARRMRRPVRQINGILRHGGAIDVTVAAELGRALGTPGDFWIARERRYRECLAERRMRSRGRA